MLKRTFTHIPGIGPKTERKLWARGILTWEDFPGEEGKVFSPERDRFIRSELEQSSRHCTDLRYFSDRLPLRENWRLYETFRERAVFLDIETSGGFGGVDEITLIGIYDGREYHTFLNGRNLTDFEIAIGGFDLIVTFNGTGFDLPFIRRFFPHITLPAVHIDLRFVLRRLGYRGGLKNIERKVGIRRETAIDGMDGFDAVRLWRAFQWGDQGALELLVQYNRADVVHLKALMEIAFAQGKSRILEASGFP